MPSFHSLRPILFVLCLFLVACSFEEVEVRDLRSLEIKDLKGKSLRLKAELRVENPNSYSIHVVKTEADVYVNDSFFGKAVQNESLKIPANFEGYLPCEVELDLTGSENFAIRILQISLSNKVKIDLDGKIRARSFIIGKSYDFTYSHETPLNK